MDPISDSVRVGGIAIYKGDRQRYTVLLDMAGALESEMPGQAFRSG
jgi:hypothetical protein